MRKRGETKMQNIIKTKISYFIEIPKIEDEGFLSFAEGNKSIPFEIKRIYYIYDVKNNVIRGKHAHKKTRQVLFCVRGSVRVLLDNGSIKEEILLTEPSKGILLDRMMWHTMHEFSQDAVLLVLASDYYEEKDYIRDYQEFLKLANRYLQKWFNPYQVFLRTIKGAI